MITNMVTNFNIGEIIFFYCALSLIIRYVQSEIFNIDKYGIKINIRRKKLPKEPIYKLHSGEFFSVSKYTIEYDRLYFFIFIASMIFPYPIIISKQKYIKQNYYYISSLMGVGEKPSIDNIKKYYELAYNNEQTKIKKLESKKNIIAEINKEFEDNYKKLNG